MGVADELITTRVDVSHERGVMREALACHASQVGADSFFFNIPEPYASLLFDVEEFIRLDCANPPAEQDLFASLEP